MKTRALGLGLAAVVAGTASADYTGAVQVAYSVTAADFGGAEVTVNVVDVYMVSGDTADTLLNVYNWNTVGGAASYFQSFTGTGWQPTNLGGPFDTAALQSADSFVTIGGFGADALQAPGAGAGTGLDPNFGGNNAAAPGADAGWYNGSPPSLNGAVMTYSNGVQGTFIGRFSSLDGAFSLEGTTFEATWNQGLGTPGQQAAFTVVPAPGALALLGMAGIVGRRRRNG
jgi:MYXO-CTERM domain-containing protein